MSYYCNNCFDLIGIFNKYNYSDVYINCFHKKSNTELISFTHCINCEKFVGLLCYHVCEKCFGKKQIIGEENLFNWFQKYNKIRPNYRYYDYYCKKCYKSKFRSQYWFFKELTFYKQ